MVTPENLKYAKTDEWVLLDGKNATIGISDYAQDQLSDIVYIEFNKDIDDVVKKEEVLSTIESVKAAGEVISPISGKVTEANNGLENTPELLNSDPYEKGWIYKIEIDDSTDYEALMTAAEYKKYCAERH